MKEKWFFQEDINDVPSYECACKPGFLGDGFNCTDACENFCYNNGRCVKEHSKVTCECKEHFEGDRCERRVLPSSKKVIYIASGIGGVVTVMIICVCVIWMICFRFIILNFYSNLSLA